MKVHSVFHQLFLLQMLTMGTTIGQATLESRGLYFDEYFFWISIAALFGFAIVYNIGFTLALSFLKRKLVFFFQIFLHLTQEEGLFIIEI